MSNEEMKKFLEENEINAQLKALYNIFWLKHGKEIMKHKMAGFDVTAPYMLSIQEEAYFRALLRVEIFGMETHFWATEYKDRLLDTELLMMHYHRFCFEKRGESTWFWKFVNKLRDWSSFELAESVYFQPNNLSKLGRCGKGSDRQVLDYLLASNSNLGRSEQVILKPDLVLVLTNNPNYDAYIEAVLGPITSSDPTKVDRISRLNIQDFAAPVYRLDHPLYLNTNRTFEQALEFCKTVIKEEMMKRYKQD